MATPDQLNTLRGIFARVTGLAATDERIAPYVPLVADHYWDEGAPTAPNDIADIIRGDYRDQMSSLSVPTLVPTGGVGGAAGNVATTTGNGTNWLLIAAAAAALWYFAK